MPSAYGYTPSLPLAVIGTIVFSLVTAYHTFLFVKLKTWFFWLMLLAALMEVTGFGARACVAVHPEQSRKYLVSYLLLILTPSIMGAALMSTFSRTIWYTTPTLSRNFRTTWFQDGILKKIFKLIYFGSFLIQFIGAGGVIGAYTSPIATEPSSPSSLILSERTLKAGFVLQVLCISLFTIILLHFIIVSRRFQPSVLLTTTTPPKPQGWRTLLFILTISSTLLVLRTTYRIFEFSSTTPDIQEYLHTHEFVFWLCDIVPVLAIFALTAFIHPGHCLPTPYTVFWFSRRKVLKLEKKVMTSQTWPTNAQQWTNGHVTEAYGHMMEKFGRDHRDLEAGGQGVGLGLAVSVDPKSSSHPQQHSKNGVNVAVNGETDPCSVSYQSPAWPRAAKLPDRS